MRLYNTCTTESRSAFTVTAVSGISIWQERRFASTSCSKPRKVRRMASARSKGFFSISFSPVVSLEASSVWEIMRESRRVSADTIRRYSSCLSAGIVPSRIPSTKPVMVVMGVLSSWVMLATNSWRMFSVFSMFSAISLKALPSSAISSCPRIRTRDSKLPREKAVTVRHISLMGFTTREVVK